MVSRLSLFGVFLTIFCASAQEYVAGTPGAAWSRQDALIIKAKLTFIMERPHIFNPISKSKPRDVDPRREMPYPAKYIRLGFHGCMKNEGGKGGCNGCMNLQKLADNTDWTLYDIGNQAGGASCHEGLLTTVRLLEKIYTETDFPRRAPALDKSMKDKGMSRADLWAFAALVGTEMGLNLNNRMCEEAEWAENKQCLLVEGLQRYFKDKNNCKVAMDLAVFQTGRSDCTDFTGHGYNSTAVEVQPDSCGNGEDTVNFYRNQFGINPREAIVLQGAHSIGKVHKFNSGFQGSWTRRNEKFVNTQYYENIVNKTGYRQSRCPHMMNGDKDGDPALVRWVPVSNLDPEDPALRADNFHWIKQYYGCPECRIKERFDKSVCPSHKSKVTGFLESFGKNCRAESRDVKPVCDGTNGQVGVDCCNTQPPFCTDDTYQWRPALDIVLNTDMGMYLDFKIDERGRPIGCPGLDSTQAWKTINGKSSWKGQGHGCDYNRAEFEGVPMYKIVEEYANDQNKWMTEFPVVLKKMLGNGYSVGELSDGPDAFTGVSCSRTGGSKNWTFKCQ